MSRRTPLLPLTLAVVAVAALFGSACTHVAALTNLGDTVCRDAFRDAVAASLEKEGESRDEARRAADDVAAADPFRWGPRPFLLSTRSGADYGFFVESKKGRCRLRLYLKQKGFVRYTNDLTYIDTRELPGCACAE